MLIFNLTFVKSWVDVTWKKLLNVEEKSLFIPISLRKHHSIHFFCIFNLIILFSIGTFLWFFFSLLLFFVVVKKRTGLHNILKLCHHFLVSIWMTNIKKNERKWRKNVKKNVRFLYWFYTLSKRTPQNENEKMK